MKQVERLYSNSRTVAHHSLLVRTLREAWELLLYLQKLPLTTEFKRSKLMSNVALVTDRLTHYSVSYSDISVNVTLLSDMELLQLQWEQELNDYPRSDTARNLLAYKKKHPNSHREPIVLQRLTSLLLDGTVCTADDYWQFFRFYPHHPLRDAIKEEFAFVACRTIADYQSYLTKYPNSKHKALILEKIEDMTFDSVLVSGMYDEYLRVYPQGCYAEVVREKQEEQRFRSCHRVRDYKAYLITYPEGRYADMARRIIKERWIVVFYVIYAIFIFIILYLVAYAIIVPV